MIEKHHAVSVEAHSIDFVPLSERYGTPRRVFTIWFSANMTILGLAQGTLAIAAGLSFRWTIAALTIGNAVGTILMIAHSAQGPQLGIPQMIQGRAKFGVLGAGLSLLAVVITYLQYCAANGVLIQGTIKALVPIGNNGPLVLFATLTLLIAFIGYGVIHRLRSRSDGSLDRTVRGRHVSVAHETCRSCGPSQHVDAVQRCGVHLDDDASRRVGAELRTVRSVQVAHSAILRWVTRYVPEFEKRWRRFSKAVGTSWRMDETYNSIKAKWHYLYRAVSGRGKTVNFLLRRDRGIAATQAFFRNALATNAPHMPRKVTLDGHVPSRRALWLLRREHPCWRNVKVRTSKYLNNLIEPDHRALKRRCASMARFKSFANATITMAGIELAHRIHKGQFSFRRGRRRRGWSRKDKWAMALA